MKNRFLEIANSIEREGNDKLLEYLEHTDFYEAPASTRFHLDYKGGLVQHSVNVCQLALKLNDTLNRPSDDGSIKIVALYHDLGKAGYNNKSYYENNKLKSGKISEAKPYIKNKSVIQLPHEVLSSLIVSEYLELSDDELWAITHHNGLYGDLKYNLIGKESPLQLLIHFSDLWASRVMEV